MTFDDQPQTIPCRGANLTPGPGVNAQQYNHERNMEQDSLEAYDRDHAGVTMERPVPWYVKRRMKKRAKKFGP